MTTGIELTYREVTHHRFRAALGKLANTNMNSNLAYGVKKMADKVKWHQKQIGEQYQKEIVDVYAKKDEKGGIVFSEKSQGDFEMLNPGQEAELVKAQEAFGTRKCSIDRPKLVLNDFGNLQMSAEDLSALEPLFVFPDEETAVSDVSAKVTPIR